MSKECSFCGGKLVETYEDFMHYFECEKCHATFNDEGEYIVFE